MELGLVGEGLGGVVGAGFFVGVEGEGPVGFDAAFFECFEGGDCDDEPALHINASGTDGRSAVVGDVELLERSFWIMDGVHVSCDEDPAAGCPVESFADGCFGLVSAGDSAGEPVGFGFWVGLGVGGAQRNESRSEEIAGVLDACFVESTGRDADMEDEVFKESIGLEGDGVGDFLFLGIECHGKSLREIKSGF